MIKFIVFVFIALFYAFIARFASFDIAILCAVTTLVLFEIERVTNE